MTRNSGSNSLSSRLILGFGRWVDRILLLLQIVIAVRALLFLSPELNNLRVAEFLKSVLEPGVDFTHQIFNLLGYEPILDGFDISLLVLFVVIMVFRNVLNWIFDFLDWTISKLLLTSLLKYIFTHDQERKETDTADDSVTGMELSTLFQRPSNRRIEIIFSLPVPDEIMRGT